MKLTRKQFKKIQPCLPKVRGNVRIDQLDFVNALLYVAENGTLAAIFKALHEEFLSTWICLCCRWTVLDGTGALKKRGLSPSEKPAAGKTQKST
ncbi:MAG: hypothetical protein Q4D38_14365 [Planctomycetia bacterium]|nr:hypothetical protein [Planctomycetia bacterium]